MIYVNAYIVSRHYGGPEEGGWWYDVGEPLSSMLVGSEAEAERVREDFKIRYSGFGSGRHRSSVLGGANLEVYIEDEFAKAFPQTKPHYE